MSRKGKLSASVGDITKSVLALYRHDKWQVFSDFVEMTALSFSNAVDKQQFEPREARYMEMIKRYTPEELELFTKMLGSLILELEKEPRDVLGVVFHELELHNKYHGQFFTPDSIATMMAKVTIGDGAHMRELIEQQGFVTMLEPCSGSGAMVIALANEMKAAGINYQNHLHVTAVDIDPKCVHMAYAQLSLLHVPSVVVHGNSLSGEQHGQWHTPARVMGAWDWRLRARPSSAEPQAAPEPVVEPTAQPAAEPSSEMEQQEEEIQYSLL